MKNSANDVAMPLITDTTAQAITTTPTIAVRRPVSASRPAGSSRTTPATAAAVGIAPARVSPKSKWSWIAGSAPATRLNSTRSMNATSAITMAGHQPKGAARPRSTGTGPRPAKASICTGAGWVTDSSRVASDIRPAPRVRGTGVRGLVAERRSYIGVMDADRSCSRRAVRRDRGRRGEPRDLPADDRPGGRRGRPGRGAAGVLQPRLLVRRPRARATHGADPGRCVRDRARRQGPRARHPPDGQLHPRPRGRSDTGSNILLGPD